MLAFSWSLWVSICHLLFAGDKTSERPANPREGSTGKQAQEKDTGIWGYAWEGKCLPLLTSNMLIIGSFWTLWCVDDTLILPYQSYLDNKITSISCDVHEA